MTHKFDVKNKHKLDNEKRRQALPPEETLIKLGLSSGDIMADIGCGIGYFSIPAAKIVGISGKVFALDISDEMIKDLEKKILDNHIVNIKTAVIEVNKLNLKNSDITFAFISLVIHELDDKDTMLCEIKRILEDNGRIAIVEWKKINSEYGPPKEHRVDKADLIKRLESLGFYNISAMDIGKNFYGLTAYKTQK